MIDECVVRQSRQSKSDRNLDTFCNAIEPKLSGVQIETKAITNKQIEAFVPCHPKPTYIIAGMLCTKLICNTL